MGGHERITCRTTNSRLVGFYNTTAFTVDLILYIASGGNSQEDFIKLFERVFTAPFVDFKRKYTKTKEQS